MRWYPAREKHLPELVGAVCEREWVCVSLSSRLIRDGIPALPSRVRGRIYIACDDFDRTAAALLQTHTGMLFPCLSDTEDCRDSLRRQLGNRIRRSAPAITMLMGGDSDVRVLESMIPSTPNHSIPYQLLTLDPGQRSSFAIDPWFQIRTADESDLEAILPMQLRYEAEEVLLPGRRLDAQAVRRSLKHRLHNQLVYLAIADGLPIAMAGTNARGFRYDQIGGVFTHEKYRNRGVSTALMHCIADHAQPLGRALCLFVKPKNHAALHLYLRMGFTRREPFRINYYQP